MVALRLRCLVSVLPPHCLSLCHAVLFRVPHLRHWCHPLSSTSCFQQMPAQNNEKRLDLLDGSRWRQSSAGIGTSLRCSFAFTVFRTALRARASLLHLVYPHLIASLRAYHPPLSLALLLHLSFWLVGSMVWMDARSRSLPRTGAFLRCWFVPGFASAHRLTSLLRVAAVITHAPLRTTASPPCAIHAPFVRLLVMFTLHFVGFYALHCGSPSHHWCDRCCIARVYSGTFVLPLFHALVMWFVPPFSTARDRDCSVPPLPNCSVSCCFALLP